MFSQALGPKNLLRHLPQPVKRSLRRQLYRWQIKRDRFVSPELEIAKLVEYVHPGDWALDIGANVGHYTKCLSDLVGPEGRVVAVEPNPETFCILAQNCFHFRYRNVTLLNLAASEQWRSVRMDQPAERLDGYYLARISNDGQIPVLAAKLDFAFPQKLRLIKIDVECHELEVLAGLADLIRRDLPALIIEAGVEGIEEYVTGLGYESKTLPGSHNLLFVPREVQPPSGEGKKVIASDLAGETQGSTLLN